MQINANEHDANKVITDYGKFRVYSKEHDISDFTNSRIKILY